MFTIGCACKVQNSMVVPVTNVLELLVTRPSMLESNTTRKSNVSQLHLEMSLEGREMKIIMLCVCVGDHAHEFVEEK